MKKSQQNPEKKVNEIITNFIARISSRQIKKILNQEINRLITNDQDGQIRFSPIFWQRDCRVLINNFSAPDWATASLFLWTAYSLYDRLIDDDNNLEILAAANLALVESVMLFANLVKPEKHYLINYHLGDLEKANQTEYLLKKRLERHPHGWNKLKIKKILFSSYRKSLGLYLPLLLIAQSQRKALINFLKFFLRARQLSDDLADWREDLQKGSPTPVIIALKKAEKKYSHLLHSEELELLFFQKIYPTFARLVKKNLLYAKRASCKIRELQPNNFLAKWAGDRLAEENSRAKKYWRTKKRIQIILSQNRDGLAERTTGTI